MQPYSEEKLKTPEESKSPRHQETKVPRDQEANSRMGLEDEPPTHFDSQSKAPLCHYDRSRELILERKH